MSSRPTGPTPSWSLRSPESSGDFKAAIKDLAAKGYGTWIDNDGKEHQNPVPKEWLEKRKKAKQSKNPSATLGANLTEWGNAKRLIKKHGENLRYSKSLGYWLEWDGCRWCPRSDRRHLEAGQGHRSKSRY